VTAHSSKDPETPRSTESYNPSSTLIANNPNIQRRIERREEGTESNTLYRRERGGSRRRRRVSTTDWNRVMINHGRIDFSRDGRTNVGLKQKSSPEIEQAFLETKQRLHTTLEGQPNGGTRPTWAVTVSGKPDPHNLRPCNRLVNRHGPSLQQDSR
jgi:hypothetical protein